MLYLLDKNVRTVRWNGEPLHEATSAIVKETMNGDFTLTVKYPISDSGIYQLIQEDMLIKAPTPVLGAQLFRIKKPIEHNDHLEITAYHISDDVMQRSITPVSVTSQSCGMALSRMVQNTKTALGDFSFNSDIQDRRTFNTTETETLYSVLLDGKHSIVGTWEGELVRDNFAMTIKKSRGENRGVVITTHKNLKDYQRTKNSQNVVTRIHAKSTFKPEGAEKETTIRVTVDSPLINSYPYINEKEYENNNAKTVEELQKWAQSKFSNEGIDKVSDAIKIEAYELDGQVVHMGDTVNLKSWKHNIDAFKKAIAYEFDALKEEYISLTFDDKAGTGGSRASGGLSSAANAILGVTESAQEIALEKALQNADLDFEHQAGLLRQEIADGIELAKAKAEENKRALSDEIDRRFHEFSPDGFDEAKTKAEEALKKAGASSELAEEAKYIADQNSVIFAGLADKLNKQEDKLGDTITDLKRYAREESASQARAVREDVTRDFVGKSTFQENVQGVERRLESLSLGTSGNLLKNSNEGFYNQHDKRYRLVETLQANQTYTLVTKYWHGENATGHTFFDGVDWRGLNYNQAIDAWMVQFTPSQNIPAGTEIILSSHPYEAKGNMSWATLVRGVIPLIHWQPAKGDIEQKLAEYKETVDGRFATISSQVNGKVNQSDFQRVKETSQLYERLFGNNQDGITNNISRMVMTNQIFQTEVKKITESSYNLVFDPTNFSKWAKKQADANVIEVGADTKLLRITNVGKNQPVYHGFALPLTTSNFRQGEKLSYRMQAWVDVLPDAPLGIELWANDSVLASDRVTFTKTGIQIISGTMTVQKSTTKTRDFPLEVWLMKNGTVAIGKVSLVRGETPPQKFEDDTTVTQTKVTQLSDSYAIQTLTNAGAIASQINTNANNILIEASKIRLKGSTLADEITAIDGRFKRLFVGEGNFATLNTDVLRSNSISGDKLAVDQALIDKLVASDVFTNTLSAKNAFINRLRSTIVSATLLEGYKGKIGGFQIGTHEKDPNSYWFTGLNQFQVGMGSGNGKWGQTALWVNWGNNWNQPGDTAWYVKNNGEMYCYNQAHFWNTPIIHGNLKVSGNIYYITDDNTKQGGYWIHSPSFKRIQENAGYIYLYHFDDSYVWIPINKEISDRRFKTNIKDSQVSGLDVIENLKTYSYRKEYDEKIEDISCGIMAQDVQKYAPEAFYENPDGVYSYNTFALVPYLIKAIQELNKKVERLETT